MNFCVVFRVFKYRNAFFGFIFHIKDILIVHSVNAQVHDEAEEEVACSSTKQMKAIQRRKQIKTIKQRRIALSNAARYEI